MMMMILTYDDMAYDDYDDDDDDYLVDVDLIFVEIFSFQT